MRKLVLFIASSLDGYIASSSGDVDWLFTDQDYGYTDFSAQVDTVLMGRRTYEQVLSFGEYPYQGTQGYVFSRSEWQANVKGDRNDNVEFINSDLASFIKELKTQIGKNIWLVGGAKIIQCCLPHDLIDEFIISIHPLILGEGIPLFSPPLPTKPLTFQRCEKFETGLIQLTYTRSAIEIN